MKAVKILIPVLLILMNLILVTGCWNYKEVDKFEIVAGVAVDKGIDSKYKITTEIVHISGGKDTKITSKTIGMEGNTMFDAVRNMISVTGNRLYWSHARVLIISKEIASDGIKKVIDWYNRDSETRADVHILISEEDTARKIFEGQETTEDIKSFELDDMLKNQISLSKAPTTDILKFDNELQGEGISAVAPAVKLKKIDGKVVPQIMGTAIFKRDKFVGFLNGEETKDLIFIKNEVKGGVLIQGTQGNDLKTPVSLEIFKNKTQVKPISNKKNVNFIISINSTVAIDEIEGSENLIDDEGRNKLEKNTEKTMKARIEALIKKIQTEYDVDIFGFGSKLREENNQLWKLVSGNWEEIFKNIQVTVIPKVHIRNSAMLSKVLDRGD